MYSIFAELVTVLAGAAFLLGSIWLAATMLDDEPVPTEARSSPSRPASSGSSPEKSLPTSESRTDASDGDSPALVTSLKRRWSRGQAGRFSWIRSTGH